MPAMTAILRAVRESTCATCGWTLTPTQGFVIQTIAGLSNPTTGLIPEAYQPTREDLIRYTRFSRATITRTIKEIDEQGWIERQRTGERGSKIVAALIPLKAHCEPYDEPTLTPLRPTVSPLRPTESLPKAHRKPDTYLLGPYGPTGLKNTVASAPVDACLVDVPLFDEPANAPTPKPAKDGPLFAEFWNAYPRKTDKGHARIAWTKAIKNGTDPRHPRSPARASPCRSTLRQVPPRPNRDLARSSPPAHRHREHHDTRADPIASLSPQAARGHGW